MNPWNPYPDLKPLEEGTYAVTVKTDWWYTVIMMQWTKHHGWWDLGGKPYVWDVVAWMTPIPEDERRRWYRTTKTETTP